MDRTSALIELIRANYDFGVGATCFPEVHPEAEVGAAAQRDRGVSGRPQRVAERGHAGGVEPGGQDQLHAYSRTQSRIPRRTRRPWPR